MADGRMLPIHELLNRIRWDSSFGQGDFVIGYYDRVADRIEHVPLREVSFEPGNHFAFTLIDAEGAAHEIPLHRIKEVIKNGELIWQRTH